MKPRRRKAANKALQILEGADSGSISLVFLDLVMPGVDGLAVLDRIGAKPNMPPIIVSDSAGLDRRRDFGNARWRGRFHRQAGQPGTSRYFDEKARSKSRRCRVRSPV